MSDRIILVRSDGTLNNVDAKQRLIDVIAVPWEQEAEIRWRGEMWREVFSRSAFNGIEDHAGRVRVNREHTRGDTVGKVVHIDTADSEGLLTRVKIARTLRGDETLALAEDDMISASIGYYVKQPSDVDVQKQRRLRRVNRAFLDHVSLVESPAYDGARVLAVREESQGLTAAAQKPFPKTPNLDELLNDDVFQWAKERVRVAAEDK